MFQFNKIIILLTIFFITTACEEVIEIDLNSANPAIVAEGVIKKEETAWIRLNYTSDYFTSEDTQKITDAQVILSDDDGNSETLLHVGNGFYEGSEIFGIENQNYNVSLQINNNLYEAETYIHAASEITEVVIEENSTPRPGHDSGFTATISFYDEIGKNNFYMLKFIINGTLQTDMYSLVDDSFYADNGIIEYNPMTLNLELDDEVEVELYSIDENTYIYYSQLNDQGGNMMNSSTPYNPQSNFGTEIMGYFAGWSVATYYFIVNPL